MWYAKNTDEGGNLISLVTYEDSAPIFTEEDSGWVEITKEEYESIMAKMEEERLKIEEEKRKLIESMEEEEIDA